MWSGTVDAIYLASAAKAPTNSVASARAIPGVGLEGDRYALKLGTFFKPLPELGRSPVRVAAMVRSRLVAPSNPGSILRTLPKTIATFSMLELNPLFEKCT